MNKGEIPTGIKEDIFESVDAKEIADEAFLVRQKLEDLLRIVAVADLSEEAFLRVADDLQKAMGLLNMQINMMRRKYKRQ